MIQQILDLSRNQKKIFVLTLDAIILLTTIWLAHCVRVEEFVYLTISHLWVFLISIGIGLPSFTFFGFYSSIFRYSGSRTILRIMRAVTIYSVFFITFVSVISIPSIPRSVGIIQPIFLFMLLSLSRVLARYFLGEFFLSRKTGERKRRVLIYGAGSAGRQLVGTLQYNSEYQMVGFIDDDVSLVGNSINAWYVYSRDEIPNLIDQKKITDIFLAIPSANNKQRAQIIESLQNLPVYVRTLPSLADITAGRLSVTHIKELEIEDLLGRNPVKPDIKIIQKSIEGKRIMVTGAGGSIGSELCRQIILGLPLKLILIEHNEFSLYTIYEELITLVKKMERKPKIIPILSSVKDEKRVHKVFSKYAADIVFHAAAYKHVPLVEFNVAEGILNNVMGTLVIAKAALEFGVENFVLISTDKAVRPTNVMGASKRVSELILQSMAQESKKTIFSMVRFGNVLGSSGSVVPLFRDQIKNGGPVTVTDKKVTRYFMTIPEAVHLVLQSSFLAEGGEVFVLDMGEPVRIYELAKKMIALSGLSVKDKQNPNGDIEINITGLRVGEKLYEELLIGANVRPTKHPRIQKAHEDFFEWKLLQKKLESLNKMAIENNVQKISSILEEIVIGFEPSKKRVDLLIQ